MWVCIRFASGRRIGLVGIAESGAKLRFYDDVLRQRRICYVYSWAHILNSQILY